MDGVFMKKLGKRMGILLLIAVLAWCGTLLADRYNLSQKIVRLHVVANSDKVSDQRVKLQVRDGILTYLEENMDQNLRPEEALQWLQQRLPELEAVTDRVLRRAGRGVTAEITLTREAFSERQYDTFSLPSGLYHSLRITLGEGEGENWWCVVFPSLCLPTTTEGFEAVAAGAGFPDSLTGALNREPEYEIRFFLLDWLGKVQNFFFGE